MGHALSYGKNSGCSFAVVKGISFQTSEFYEKIGFEVEYNRSVYFNNIHCSLFKK
jgi:hypothetical protein